MDVDVVVFVFLFLFFGVVSFYMLSHNGGYSTALLEKAVPYGLSHTAVRFTIHIRSATRSGGMLETHAQVHTI